MTPFYLKLRPAETFYIQMWPLDGFEFETPALLFIYFSSSVSIHGQLLQQNWSRRPGGVPRLQVDVHANSLLILSDPVLL
jgi:hypothetical protein